MSRHKKWLGRLAWLIPAAFVVFSLARWDPRFFPHDYFYVWAAAEATKMPNVDNLYTNAVGERANQEMQQRFKKDETEKGRFANVPRFRYYHLNFTPLLISVTRATMTGDFRTDYQRFRVVSALVFGFGFLTLAWALGIPALVAGALLYFVTWPSWAFKMGVFVANTGLFHAGAFMACLAILRKRTPLSISLSAFGVGLLGFLKPTLLFAVPMLLVSLACDKRWKDLEGAALGLVASGVAAFVFPYLVVGGAATWFGWVAQVPGEALNSDWLRHGTFFTKITGSLSPILNRVGSPLLMAIVAWFFWKTPTSASHALWSFPRDAAATASGALVYLLTGPVVHSHYFLQAIASGLILLRPRGLAQPAPWARWASALFCLFLLGGHRLFKQWLLVSGANHSWLTFLGVWFLLVLTCWDRWETKRSGPSLSAP